MDYLTSQEAADKWGLSKRSVQLYCKNGKIPGAINLGKQWLVPENAEKPLDIRFAKNKVPSNSEVYHFPILVYTKYFVSRSELSEDERLLLDAQIINLRCEYTESVRICNKLIQDSVSDSVRLGAWLTNMLNFIFLGLASRLPECINAMDSICAKPSPHQEDYRLIIAFLDYTYRFDPSRYTAIDVSKLSSDALTTYKLVSMIATLFSEIEPTENTVRMSEAVLKETELLGIAPAALTMHGLIAMLYSRRGNIEAKMHHIEQVCRIGHEGGFLRLLTKCSSLDIDSYVRCISKYGSSHGSELRERCLRNRSCWQITYAYLNGANPAIDVSLFEAEIGLLLVYKTPIRDIALLKNVPEKEVRKTIKEMCERLSLTSRKELVELFRAVFSPAADGQTSGAMPHITDKE